MNNLNHLLMRGQTLGDIFANRLFGNFRDEIFDDFKIDISFKEREPNGLHRLADIGFIKAALAAEFLENRLEAVGKTLEHSVVLISLERRDLRSDCRSSVCQIGEEVAHAQV